MMIYYIIIIACLISNIAHAGDGALRTSGHSRARSMSGAIDCRLVGLGMGVEPQARHSLPPHLQKFPEETVHRFLVIQSSRSSDPVPASPETLLRITARYISDSLDQMPTDWPSRLPAELVELVRTVKGS